MPQHFVSMELPKRARAEYAAPAPADMPEGPRYPSGLAITLNDESLEKLGVETLPEAGAELVIVAKVTVTRVEKLDTAEDGQKRELGLQITHLAFEPGKRATADVLFAGKQT